MSADVTIEYTVKVSYMEIYMERIKDLLARKLASLAELRLAESGQLRMTIYRSTRTRREASMSKA